MARRPAVEQVQLKYVNTDLATFTGAEAVRRMRSDRLADAVRDAELRRGPGSNAQRRFRHQAGHVRAARASRDGLLPRGYSGVAGAAEEPLPGIVPLESRWASSSSAAADAPVECRVGGPRGGPAGPRGHQPVGDSLARLHRLGPTRLLASQRRLLMSPASRTSRTGPTANTSISVRGSGIQMFQPGINFYTGSELNY